jgi:hypothetical protein
MLKFSQHLRIALIATQEQPEVDSRVVRCLFCSAETQSCLGGYPVCLTCSDELEKRELPEPDPAATDRTGPRAPDSLSEVGRSANIEIECGPSTQRYETPGSQQLEER